jgi:hypothetical protein
MELTINGNFRSFATNGKQKQQTSLCLLQTEKKTEVCFLWSANDNRQSTIAAAANMPAHQCLLDL